MENLDRDVVVDGTTHLKTKLMIEEDKFSLFFNIPKGPEGQVFGQCKCT